MYDLVQWKSNHAHVRCHVYYSFCVCSPKKLCCYHVNNVLKGKKLNKKFRNSTICDLDKKNQRFYLSVKNWMNKKIWSLDCICSEKNTIIQSFRVFILFFFSLKTWLSEIFGGLWIIMLGFRRSSVGFSVVLGGDVLHNIIVWKT